jgi:hypothetical protein
VARAQMARAKRAASRIVGRTPNAIASILWIA